MLVINIHIEVGVKSSFIHKLLTYMGLILLKHIINIRSLTEYITTAYLIYFTLEVLEVLDRGLDGCQTLL